MDELPGNSWPAGSPIINVFWSTGGTPSRSNVWKSVTRISLETCRDMPGAWSTSWSSTGTPLAWISSQPGVSCVLPAWSRFASRSTPVRLDGGRTTSRTFNRCSRPSSDTESSWLRIERSQQIPSVRQSPSACALGQRCVVLECESKCLHAAGSMTRSAFAPLVTGMNKLINGLELRWSWPYRPTSQAARWYPSANCPPGPRTRAPQGPGVHRAVSCRCRRLRRPTAPPGRSPSLPPPRAAGCPHRRRRKRRSGRG